MRFNRRALLLLAACAALGGGASRLAAQNTGSVRGRVVEASTLRPMTGVQVTVPGTGRGALSDAAGNFLINNVPLGAQTVRADMLGYTAVQHPATVGAGQTAVVDFQLSQTVLALNEIVVTGVPGATSKRTLGNSISKLDAADLTEKATFTNVTDLLQSRTPGLTFLANAGIPGAAGEMRIRGAGSIAMSNYPVVFVDGIRYYTGSHNNFSPSGAGNSAYEGQGTSAIDMIDPGDIESVEVIKGPAAATLYGAEAAAGVIQIITKKGKLGQQPLQWTAKVEYGGSDWALPIPNNYTTCDVTRITGGSDAANWPGCAGQTAGTVLVGNPLRDDPASLRTGLLRHGTLNLRGGGDNFSYYLSGDHSEEQGVFFASNQVRNSLRANFVIAPSNKVDLNASTSYVRSNLRLPVGDESGEGLVLSAFRGRPGRVASYPGREGWGGYSATEANQYNNTTVTDRLTLGSTLNIRPLQWFKNRLTLGLDYEGSLAQVLFPPNSPDALSLGTASGGIAQKTPRNYTWTVDYAGNVDARVLPDLLATTSFGAQYVGKHFDMIYGYGYGMAAPDMLNMGVMQTFGITNTFSENKSFGIFGQEQLGWKDRLYVTGALRMDNNSSFGEDIRRFLYPKASLSYVASDEPALRRYFEALHVDNFKFRTAWGRAGRAPDPYWADQTYTAFTVVQGTALNNTLGVRALGNPNLKPETGNEIEVGFESALFQDRGGIDFTYYHKNMNGVLLAMPIAGSTGWAGTFTYGVSSPYQNIGSTMNEGIEASLRVTPILKPKLSWDTRVDLSTNRNRLVDFADPNRKSLTISGQSYAAVQQHRRGFPLGGYWASVPKRNADGSLVLTATGLATPTDTVVYLGSSMPTRQAAWSNTLTLFRNVRLYAMFDYMGGFNNFNAKSWYMCRVQQNCEAVNDAANRDLTQPLNLAVTPPKNKDMAIWLANITGYWIQPADFIKFRDLSVTYTVPPALLRNMRMKTLSFTAAAHNLGIVWTRYGGIDPEANSYNNQLMYSTMGFTRTDLYAPPMMRRITMSANVSF